MTKESTAQENALIVGVRIKSIKRAGKADVYCLAGLRNGTMIANGIITRNCDALRYALHSHKVAVYEPYAHNPADWQKNKYNVTRSF